MGDIPTVAIKNGDNDYMIINESDFDEKKGHVRYDGVLPRDTVTDTRTRNSDGTFSEPTPTDIRFPNKDNTEFANNHGAFVGKSAAEMREAEGLADAPGGLKPDPVLAEVVKAEEKAVAAAAKEDAKAAEKAADKEDAKPAATSAKK